MNDLFVHQLQDIHYAEKQLVKALPKMADKSVLDAALINAGQAAEHDAIARYGSLIARGPAAWPQRLRQHSPEDARRREDHGQQADLARRGKVNLRVAR